MTIARGPISLIELISRVNNQDRTIIFSRNMVQANIARACWFIVRGHLKVKRSTIKYNRNQNPVMILQRKI